MSIVPDDLAHVSVNNGAGPMATMDAETPDDALETTSSAEFDEFFEPGDVSMPLLDPPSFLPPADNGPSVKSFTSQAEAEEISLPTFDARNAFRYYQNPRQNAARAAAPVVFVTPFSQDEVARVQATLRGPFQGPRSRPKATKRPAIGSNPTRRAKGKKKAAQQGKPDASLAFQNPQRSVDLLSYRYVVPPIAPCSELAPWQALYVFPDPYEADMMSPVLIQWIDMHRAPVFPEELDLVFVVCWKVPEEKVPRVLAYMQRSLSEKEEA